MQIYLPIAEMSVNVFLLLGMGGAVGFLSGLFGVGGGFLMTPLLIFVGVPPAVAVGSEANQIVAASVSGVLAHWRRGNVDVKMTLTFAGCGMGPYIAQQAEWRIAEIEGVEDVNVEMVFDPPWTPDQITEDGKKLLGLD